MAHDPAASARVRELFLQALELPEPERAALLASVTGRDPGLACEVESLLRFAADTVAQPGPQTGGLVSQVMNWAPGDRVRDFTLHRLLGTGASGDVFVASQDEPRREVALKILRRGGDPETLERFRLEGAALGRLNHDHVARVFAVGAEGGRLFLALELVPGLPLTRYSDEHRLTVERRIGLFLKLCGALEHIHQNGLIHRDLKPSNVVASGSPDDPSLKVIDFGIAKSLVDQGDSGLTMDGAVLATIEYASPEQLRDSRAVDTRTDIYSVGVMLYELLVGTRPFRITEMGLVQFLAEIQERDAPLPSNRLAASGDGAATVASLRRTSQGHLSRTLRSDLDWIVAKALRKSPAERYATAGELRADLERYLKGETVGARPPSLGYRLRKNLWRSRRLVLAAAGLLASVAVGLIATSRQAAIATARLRELEGLTADLVSSVNDIVDMPGAMAAKRRLVTSAARSLEQMAGAGGSPDLQMRLAEAYERIGQLRADPDKASLGELSQGVQDLARAVTIRERLYHADSSLSNATYLLQSQFSLAIVLMSGQSPPSPDSLIREVLARGEPLLARHPRSHDLIRVLAQAYDLHAEQEMVAGRWERTMDLVRRAHALRQVMVDTEPVPDDAEWWISQSIGRLAYATPDVRLAREEALRALAIQERYYARRPFSYHGLLDVSFARRNAAYALQRCGSIDSAIALYRQCLDVRRVIAGADASDLRGRFHLANAAAWLAGGFLAAGQTDSALTYAHLGHRIGWSVATATNAPVWADEGLRFHRLTVARALRHAGREAESDSVYAIVCREAVGVPLDKVRFARGWIERGHGRLAAGDRAMADSCFSAAEQTLLLATVPLEFRSADATPFADVALMLVHLAQVAGRDSGRRRRVLEKAMALPRIDGDPRPVRPLIENELACALAEQAQRDESIRLLRGALARGPKGDLRSALQSNLAALERTGPGAGHSIQPYDASRDPYAKLDLLLFRMIGIWGEHPVPPASRLATARS